MVISEQDDPASVRAAGAVLWRSRPDSRAVEVALVHRPRHDDWSLPKGKLEPGELAQAAAVREIAEETGFQAVLGRRLYVVKYRVRTRDGRSTPKTVDYFSARAVAGSFRRSGEVDELRWLSVAEAAEQGLPGDRPVLAAFAALPPTTRTLLLVRHAKAGKRADWHGDDDLRPLSPGGVRQAEALRRLLPLYGGASVHAAPRVRCEQTVLGLAKELRVPVRREPLLSEEGYWPDPEAGIARLVEIAAVENSPVVCSQGGVIPDVVARLAVDSALPLARIASRKGSLWVLSFLFPFAPRGTAELFGVDGVATAENSQRNRSPARLVAADYLDDPLP